MKVTARGRQLSYGEAIGILLIENYAPFIPGDTANATSYRYPVRFQPFIGLTVEKLFSHDTSSLAELERCALALQEAGVRGHYRGLRISRPVPEGTERDHQGSPFPVLPSSAQLHFFPFCLKKPRSSSSQPIPLRSHLLCSRLSPCRRSISSDAGS